MNNSQEPIRRWMERQEHGRTHRREFRKGNISFVNDTVLSYGWWPMARVEDWDNKIALFRSYSYSVSTAGHMSAVRRYLHQYGFTVFTVPVVCDGDDSYGHRLRRSHHEKNLEYYEREITNALESADRASVYRESLMNHAQGLIDEMDEYVRYFGLAEESSMFNLLVDIPTVGTDPVIDSWEVQTAMA